MQVASIVLAALALTASAAAPVAEDSAEIQTALGEDDTCAATGDEGARCALNALQLRAAKAAQEANSTEEEGNACYTGMVGQIRNYAPSCFSHCPQMCSPLAQEPIRLRPLRLGLQRLQPIDPQSCVLWLHPPLELGSSQREVPLSAARRPWRNSLAQLR